MKKVKGTGTLKPQNKGYSEAGASLTRRALKGFIPNSGSPVDDINANGMTLRQRSRMLYMSSPLATSAINTNRTKVVGTGLTFKAALDIDVLGMSAQAAKEWQRKTESEFALWSMKKQNCDAIGSNNYYGLQQLAFKSWMMSGDVFALIKRAEPTALNPYSLRIHLIEADRISTPLPFRGVGNPVLTEGKVTEGNPGAGHKIHDGVEVDDSGNVVAYYICSKYPNQVWSGDPLTWTRVEAYGKETGLPNILHIMDSERPDQYRGVPYVAPVIESLLQLRRYTESELMAALVQSFFTAWIQTESDTTEIPFNEVGAGDIDGMPSENPETENLSQSDNEYEMGPGTVTHLAPGEKVAFGNPTIPTAGFEVFVKTLCKLVGSGLELPYDVLVKEFNSSYSASRGALLEAWEAFKMRRTWFVDDFCQPIYELWLSEAVARGRIKAPGYFDDPLVRSAWQGARWIGPVQGQLDPNREANAAMTLIGRGIKTHEQVTRELGGGDWFENIEQMTIENDLLRTANENLVVTESEPSEEPPGEGEDDN